MVMLAVTMSVKHRGNIYLVQPQGYGGHPGEEGGFWLLSKCQWKGCHRSVSSALRTTSFQNKPNPPLGWFIQLVKKAAAEFRRITSMGAQGVWLCKTGGERKRGNNFSVV